MAIPGVYDMAIRSLGGETGDKLTRLYKEKYKRMRWGKKGGLWSPWAWRPMLQLEGPGDRGEVARSCGGTNAGRRGQ